MDDNIKIENNISNYKSLAANAKYTPILFVCLSITITYIYNIFSQLHILLFVARWECGSAWKKTSLRFWVFIEIKKKDTSE